MPTNPRPPRPLTERLEASRSVKTDAITRELLWAAIGSRIWPAFITLPWKRQTGEFTHMLCIDSPAGRIAYRLRADELPMFEHLPRKENDGLECGAGDKLSRLLHLATDGWKP